MDRPGLLFDMDGVLIDSTEFHYQAWKHLAKEEPSLDVTHERFLGTFGMANDEILQLFYPQSSPQERQRLALRKEELFRSFAKEHLTLLPGMQRFLDEVKAKNLPRIIGSNAPAANLRFFLENSVLGDYFNQFVSGEEVARGKPAPDVYLEGARRLHLSPKDCIVIEDSPHGLMAGLAAGCFVVALATTNPKELLNPKHILFLSPKELSLSTLIPLWQAH